MLACRVEEYQKVAKTLSLGVLQLAILFLFLLVLDDRINEVFMTELLPLTMLAISS